jgi:ribosomal protein S18 acetylase RimI-like enzyme
MTNIQIFPIFNQAAPMVWDDFLRIRTLTRQQVYHIETSPQDYKDTMAEFQEYWQKPSNNFAFGAYDNNNMIGFISGTFETRYATIQHLYVLPQYQGKHIGAQLLKSAESAISVDRNNVELISMTKAENFYKKYGYISYNKTNRYNKSVKDCGHCAVAPVFRCTATIIKQMAKLSGQPLESFDKKSIIKNHTPVFIYRDVKSNITGFGICNAPTPQIHATNDWARSRIEKAITEYQKHIQTKGK